MAMMSWMKSVALNSYRMYNFSHSVTTFETKTRNTDYNVPDSQFQEIDSLTYTKH